MRASRTRLDGPLLIEPVVHGDERGFFLETYRSSEFAELGIDDSFVQDNQSRSRQGIVRGMHFQPGMSKLIRCARGAILDVLVDIRPRIETFGEWEAFALDDGTISSSIARTASRTASASSARSRTSSTAALTTTTRSARAASPTTIPK